MLHHKITFLEDTKYPQSMLESDILSPLMHACSVSP